MARREDHNRGRFLLKLNLEHIANLAAASWSMSWIVISPPAVCFVKRAGLKSPQTGTKRGRSLCRCPLLSLHNLLLVQVMKTRKPLGTAGGLFPPGMGSIQGLHCPAKLHKQAVKTIHGLCGSLNLIHKREYMFCWLELHSRHHSSLRLFWGEAGVPTLNKRLINDVYHYWWTTRCYNREYNRGRRRISLALMIQHDG